MLSFIQILGGHQDRPYVRRAVCSVRHVIHQIATMRNSVKSCGLNSQRPLHHTIKPVQSTQNVEAHPELTVVATATSSCTGGEPRGSKYKGPDIEPTLILIPTKDELYPSLAARIGTEQTTATPKTRLPLRRRRYTDACPSPPGLPVGDEAEPDIADMPTC